MSYQINFGNITAAKSPARVQKTRSFRIAVLGDFSGRANRGELETGAALAARKPLKVDCDNFDAIMERLDLKLALPFGDGAIEIPIGTLDDFHPDELYEKLPIFSELSGLRQRLKTTSTFAKAAKEVQSWAGQAPPESTPAPARGTAIPAEGQLSDFAQLLGRPAAEVSTEPTLHELLKQIVAPHVVAAKDPQQDAMLATVDQSLAAMMRAVLHHPDFQTMEALWRSVDFLVRRLETDIHLQIILLDITAEEIAADLSREDALESSGLYQLLVELPAQDANQGPYSAIVGHYLFEHTAPHAELLGRLARIAAQAQAPFIAGISPACIDVKPDDVPTPTQEAWRALQALPEAAWVGLTTPRFLLRLPYGEKTEPVDSFDFEEYDIAMGPRALLWGNSAVLAGFLLGANFTRDGVKMTARGILGVNELPLYYYDDKDGDQVALPCSERLLASRDAATVQALGFMAVLAMKGSPEVRLAGFRALARTDLAGWWAPPAPAPAAPEEPAAEAAEPMAEELPAEETGGEEPSAEEIPAEEAAPEEVAAADEEAAPAAESAETDGLDDLLAGLEEPAPTEAAPPADEGTDSAALDDLLAGLEEPAPTEATAPAAETDGLDVLDSLLAGTGDSAPAEAPAPVEAAAAAEVTASAEDAAAYGDLESLLGSGDDATPPAEEDPVDPELK